jgi:hypothetical protein
VSTGTGAAAAADVVTRIVAATAAVILSTGQLLLRGRPSPAVRALLGPP